MGMAAESQFHVLAVDDSLFDRKFIERLLQKSSCQVTTVDSGYKALEFLGLREGIESKDPNPVYQEVEVNLIITDYCMPGMTGYDLLKKLKESSAFKNIPVVIMSSENVPERITRCLEEGAEEFLLKPVRLADLNKLKTKLKNQKLENGVNTEEFEPEIKNLTEIEFEMLPLQQDLQEEMILKDRTRPRFDKITTAVYFIAMMLLFRSLVLEFCRLL